MNARTHTVYGRNKRDRATENYIRLSLSSTVIYHMIFFLSFHTTFVWRSFSSRIHVHAAQSSDTEFVSCRILIGIGVWTNLLVDACQRHSYGVVCDMLVWTDAVADTDADWRCECGWLYVHFFSRIHVIYNSTPSYGRSVPARLSLICQRANESYFGVWSRETRSHVSSPQKFKVDDARW